MKKDNIAIFLKEHYLEDWERLYEQEQIIYKDCIDKIQGKSPTQKKTMINTILPRVALYKTLCNNGYSEDESKEMLAKYMAFDLTSMIQMMQRLDRLPFFFGVLRKMFSQMLKADNWIIKNASIGKKELSFDIVSCLWYNTCVEYDCENLCSVFCDGDYLTFGGLKRAEFRRTGTIASGCGKCDFKFVKTRK